MSKIYGKHLIQTTTPLTKTLYIPNSSVCKEGIEEDFTVGEPCEMKLSEPCWLGMRLRAGGGRVHSGYARLYRPSDTEKKNSNVHCCYFCFQGKELTFSQSSQDKGRIKGGNSETDSEPRKAWGRAVTRCNEEGTVEIKKKQKM